MSSDNRAIIYARVSTKNQKEYGRSLPTQVKGCQEYAERHGLDVVEIIKDDVSGATRLDEREGGRRVLELVEAGKAGALVVWRLDRLSRPPEGEYSRLLTTIEAMGRHGVVVHDCEVGAIQNSMESIFIAFFKGLAASKEREAITERSTRGRKAKAKAGKYVGTGWAPYGYRKVGKRHESHLEIVESEAAVVRRIFDMFTGKHGRPMSMRHITKVLNLEQVPNPGKRRGGRNGLWDPSNLRDRVLRREAYRGRFDYAGVKMDFPELAIIDAETWDEAQRRLGKSKAYVRNAKWFYLLSCRITCTCGGTMTGFSVKKGAYLYYRCKRKTTHGPHVCKQTYLPVETVDARAWAWLVDVISNDERLDEIIGEMVEQAAQKVEPAKKELATVEQLLQKAQRKIERLLSAFGDETNEVVAGALKGEIGATTELVDSLQRQRDGLQATIANAEITPVDRQEILSIARKVRRNLKAGGTPDDRLALIEALDVQGQLVYRDGQPWLEMSCGLGAAESVCLENGLRQERLARQTTVPSSRPLLVITGAIAVA